MGWPPGELEGPSAYPTLQIQVMLSSLPEVEKERKGSTRDFSVEREAKALNMALGTHSRCLRHAAPCLLQPPFNTRGHRWNLECLVQKSSEGIPGQAPVMALKGGPRSPAPQRGCLGSGQTGRHPPPRCRKKVGRQEAPREDEQPQKLQMKSCELLRSRAEVPRTFSRRKRL